MDKYLEIGQKAVKKAGDILLSYISKDKNVTLKSISNLVTDVDRISEKTIINIIEENFPDYSVLSEELGMINKGSEYTWIIDPLDGTTNYAHNFPFFGISIALTKESEILLGITYDPIRNELFYAIKNEGAYLNDKKITVSSTKKLSDSLISMGLPYELTLNEKNFLPFINFSSRTHGIRRAGSAILEIAYVACGRLDGFWARNLKPWDIASGIILVKEAGGKVTNFEGKEIDSVYIDNVLISNGNIHDEMIEVLKLDKIYIKR